MYTVTEACENTTLKKQATVTNKTCSPLLHPPLVSVHLLLGNKWRDGGGGGRREASQGQGRRCPGRHGERVPRRVTRVWVHERPRGKVRRCPVEVLVVGGRSGRQERRMSGEGSAGARGWAREREGGAGVLHGAATTALVIAASKAAGGTGAVGKMVQDVT